MMTAGSCAAAPVGVPSLRPPNLRPGGFLPCSMAAWTRAGVSLRWAQGAKMRTPPPAAVARLNRLLCGYMRRDGHEGGANSQESDDAVLFGPDDDNGTKIPSQIETLVKGTATVTAPEYKPIPDLDYLQELLAIQQQGPRSIGFFGTRNMGYMHQQLIEILSYAMVITKNHIFTSGASGTNAAVIRGALRAEKPELLTVILPQSLKKQPPESQELLSKVRIPVISLWSQSFSTYTEEGNVQNLIEKPQYDHLPLIEASRLCNMDIISKVQQVICFAFHDSKLLMETCQEAKNLRKIVTLFYLD
ncbi:hypothetical protein PR202_ga10760 [Eleusine coracana subsp. coracana]|uniref:Uncharacterized protein n=1 Tax=Eleusine coracana subsp. coracana TaxID=191504 RepID=A0AAV5C7J3_ELECO|nr:hypothetical protein PR202_ga10760 [Eleusine coracana subsp. coracana]